MEVGRLVTEFKFYLVKIRPLLIVNIEKLLFGFVFKLWVHMVYVTAHIRTWMKVAAIVWVRQISVSVLIVVVAA